MTFFIPSIVHTQRCCIYNRLHWEKSVKVTRIKFTESRRPFSRTHRSLEDYRICYTAIEESNWDILPSEFCQKRNWFQLYQKKRDEQLNSQWKSLFQFNISGRTKRSTSTPEEMFCRMPCQRVPVWITEKRLLQILGHPPGRYFIKENIFFGGKSYFILPKFRAYGQTPTTSSLCPTVGLLRPFLSREYTITFFVMICHFYYGPCLNYVKVLLRNTKTHFKTVSSWNIHFDAGITVLQFYNRTWAGHFATFELVSTF